MDLNALLRLVFLEKNDITFGVLMGLLLVVVIWLLVRSVVAEKTGAASASDESAIDAKAINSVIEGALKKALGENGAGAIANASGELSVDAKELKKTLNEREAKISALMSDLEMVKGQIDKVPKSGGGEETASLQTKIKELSSKLAEYEIIEDDIADLSIYKEENKKLKDEVERLRAAVETARTQVQAAQLATDPAPLVDAVQAAQAAVFSAANAPPVSPTKPAASRRPAVDAFKLDVDDDVMGEFAQALSSETPKPKLETNLVSGDGAEIADPNAAMEALFKDPAPAAPEEEPGDSFGELDTDKMLAEVASMNEASPSADASSVLDEQLDTDRLMAEMGMGDASTAEAAEVSSSTAPVAAAAPVAPQAAPTMSPERAAAAKPVIVESEIPVDDLLAEFKDTDFLKGTKGS